jgi:hypothetical protein
LRARLQMLRGVYDAVMPYRDPHTAAPALWAQRQISGEDFEASTTVIDGDVRSRKAAETIAIALYRHERGQSPTFNFGRMPPGYRMSSANNRRLTESGRRFRGGPCGGAETCHLPSLAPVGTLEVDAESEAWCGHPWSRWISLRDAGKQLNIDASGLYRIRGRGTVIYIGEGGITTRLRTHADKGRRATLPQDLVFAQYEPLECSWVINTTWVPHQRQELETDLIAAFTIATGSPPAAQFIG